MLLEFIWKKRVKLRRESMKTRTSHAIIVAKIAAERIEKGCCPSCGKPKSEWKRRKDWRCCSAKCTDEYWGKYVEVNGWQDLRKQCFKRDNFTCKMCGKQPTTETMYPDFKEHLIKSQRPYDQYGSTIYTIVDTSKLIADHIVPIAVGGEQWDIENIQTLCEDCNKIKTRGDMGVIAEARRIEKKLVHGQKTLGETCD